MMQLLQKSEDAVCGWLRGIDAALLRTVAAAAALCMLLAHGFAFTNLFPNHDSTVLVFDAQWTMYVLGRWAQNLYFPLVRGKIAAPWLIGAFSIVYLALTGYIIAKLLHLRRWSAALLTCLLGTCASVTAQLATYTYETDAYLLAMLLACAAVWCSQRLPRLWGYAGAAVCLCGCLALYQSYIQFAVGLYLLLLLQSALQGAEWRPWLRQGVGALLTLVLGAVLYVVSLKVSLALTGYQLADTGNGLAQMFRLGPTAVLAGIPATYGNFFKTLLGYSGWNDRGMRAATALLFVLAAAGLVLRPRRTHGGPGTSGGGPAAAGAERQLSAGLRQCVYLDAARAVPRLPGADGAVRRVGAFPGRTPHGRCAGGAALRVFDSSQHHLRQRCVCLHQARL